VKAFTHPAISLSSATWYAFRIAVSLAVIEGGVLSTG
jgi:hypothetical protein